MRKKLINLLLHFDETCVADFECATCVARNEEDCEVCARAAFLIANGVTIPEWISVDERLPEESGSYLVFSRKSETVFTAHFWKSDSRWANRANGQFITHWMRLPEPPIDKEKEDCE